MIYLFHVATASSDQNGLEYSPAMQVFERQGKKINRDA